MQPRTFLHIFKTAAQRWIDRDAFEHAAALGFCTLFSLAPLVIIVVAIVGGVFGADAASGQISVAISDIVGPQAALAVEGAVRRSRLEGGGIDPHDPWHRRAHLRRHHGLRADAVRSTSSGA